LGQYHTTKVLDKDSKSVIFFPNWLIGCFHPSLGNAMKLMDKGRNCELLWFLVI